MKLSTAFKTLVEPLIKNKPLSLVFLQDELSADDLTKYASSYPHLQRIFQTKPYTLVPSVTKEKSSIDKLISNTASEVEYVDSGSLSDWKRKDGDAKVVVFHLEPVSGSTNEGKRAILKSNDLAMHRIVKAVGEKEKDFGVVYTAEDASQLIANILLEENVNDDNGMVSRHLLQANTGNHTQRLFNNSCVMVHVNSIQHVINGTTTEFITSALPAWKTGGCGSNNLGCSISMERPGVFGNYTNATLLIEFKNKTANWYCSSLHFSGVHGGVSFTETYPCGVTESVIESPVNDRIDAPMGMSFACHKLTFTIPTTKNESKDKQHTTLILNDIQIQTACDGSGVMRSFNSAYHCVGFFTIEIWTGIFVTLVLMFGLYVGIMMMMAIQVQDRLDDPKGKTISMTPASE